MLFLGKKDLGQDHLFCFWHFRAPANDSITELLLKMFQSMTAQIGNVDCHAALVLVERYVE